MLPQLVTYSYQNTSKYMNKFSNVRDTVLERNAIEFTGMTVKPSLVSTLFFLSGRKTRNQKTPRLSGQKGYFCAEISSLFDLLEMIVS